MKKVHGTAKSPFAQNKCLRSNIYLFSRNHFKIWKRTKPTLLFLEKDITNTQLSNKTDSNNDIDSNMLFFMI